MDEFTKLTEPTDIGQATVHPFRPAGRELFFNAAYRRKNERAKYRKDFTAKFLNKISENSVVCPYDTRQEVISIVDKLLLDGDKADVWQLKSKKIFAAMQIESKPDVLQRMHQNADRRKVSIEDANFQEFFMDSYVVAHLASNYGMPNLRLLSDQDHWNAYGIADETDERLLGEDTYFRTAIRTSNLDSISSDPQVKEFFEIFFHADEIPLSELIRYKRARGGLIRDYIRSKENSIRHKSLARDSLLDREGIYKYIDATSENTLPIFTKLYGAASNVDHFSALDDNISKISDTISSADELGLFENAAYKMEAFNKNKRQFVVKTKIRLATAFWWLSFRRTEGSMKYYPMFLDTVGFVEDFNRFQRDLVNMRISGTEPSL
ncbi:hypothetical protein [Rhizobium leguminosarum]|uniref:hypothetical protein n=1 Tax=Rhizobium leguminosarum TaxID=384 RepID=UPI001C94383D|nr:hypothetical protein [Rhizobium leguminosarum]MBY5361903.1 hypothetical protein [Rhizobium leguminosarum]MBY5664933.1 hypothetical protein [Rhizobium leguminosarum]MBY5677583.1 hypothetical protein [Rhizobium leguminosarum]